MSELTERQQQIKDLLDQGVPAREVGDKLGITRNAVYQQIASMRKKGALPLDYTPGGTASTAAGAPRPADAGAGLDVIRMLVTQNGQLIEQNGHLIEQNARLTQSVGEGKGGRKSR